MGIITVTTAGFHGLSHGRLCSADRKTSCIPHIW